MSGKKKPDEQPVRVAPLGELRAYTISEHELEKLEQGTPVSDLLTIGYCLLSIAATILVTLLSTSVSGTTLTLFYCSLLITGIIGAICTFIGWRGHTSTKELAKQIRARMPAAPTVQQVTFEELTGGPLLEPKTPSASVQATPASTPSAEPSTPAGRAATAKSKP